MSQPAIKGWCPGALRPMESGDGLIVRIRPHLARLDRAQAAAIAKHARTHGNGLIELTARGNIQLRGVRPHTYMPLRDGLARLGLIDADEDAEARRNVVVTPFWRAGGATQALAEQMERALAHAPALPGKFGFAVDTGPAPVLSTVSADIRLERADDGQLLLRADGAALGLPVTRAQAVDKALLLARWFLTSGGAPEGRGRMAAHLQGGAVLPESLAGTRAPARPAQPARPGAGETGLLVAIAFGQIAAETLMTLATRASALRITPWRMLLLEGADGQTVLPADETLIMAADDPRLRVAACPGAPACAQSHQPTRALALRLAAHLPPGKILHVSGCAKGCAHPGKADITLSGRAEGFTLIRNGRAADTGSMVAADPNLIVEYC